MNTNQIVTAFDESFELLTRGKLKGAIDITRQLTDELQMGHYVDRLDDIGLNYGYLLQYYVSGAADPQRKSVYNKLVARFFVLLSEIKEELLLRNSNNFEYTQKRYFPHTERFASPVELQEALMYFHQQWEILAQLPDTHEVELERIRSNYELALPDLFSLFWLSTHIDDACKALFDKLMMPDYPGVPEQCLMVSGLTLNIWRMFDEQKLILLIDCCKHSQAQVRLRALTGLWLVLHQYSKIMPFFPLLRNRLVLLTDDTRVMENLRNIAVQVIATAETDKITRKMKEEILPELMKISPLLKDKSDVDNLLNSDEWGEENPAWQEIIENSGASDKIKELTDLQLEGADVYMSTFSMLKNFPFFGDFSNWFLPFDSGFRAVNKLFKADDITLLKAFVSNNVMCNSDKYSFCLSILQMPESQRSMLTQSFKMEAEQLDEIAKDQAIISPEQMAKNISKQYIQDLFRIFRLHPYHNDFPSIFVSSLQMHQSYLFQLMASEADFVAGIAGYYFQKNHYRQALDLFELLVVDNPSSALYQKIGYCHQQLSELHLALDAYCKADIIQPDDLWTIRKMALCYRLSGDYTKALEFYKHADFLKPNQASVLLQVGRCYMALRNFKDALTVYLQLEQADPDNPKVLRAISWCALVAGNLAQADYYMQRLLELGANERDMLNAGHIAWCQRNVPLAVQYYKKCLSMKPSDTSWFFDLFEHDKQVLLANGVDADELPLMLDELFNA